MGVRLPEESSLTRLTRPLRAWTCERNSFGFAPSSAAYRVDALDQRVAKSGGSGDTRDVFGSQTQPLAEREPNGWSNYIWFGNELVG